MKLLLKLFFDICLLKARPQDVPASGALLSLTAILVMISGVASILSPAFGLAQSIMVCLLDVALTLVLLALFLHITNLSSRLIQTATAVFGTGVIINLVSLPVVRLLDAGSRNQGYGLLGGVFYFALLLWSVVIMGHILRHSFNLRLSGGILIAVAYFLLINTLVQTLLPAG